MKHMAPWMTGLLAVLLMFSSLAVADVTPYDAQVWIDGNNEGPHYASLVEQALAAGLTPEYGYADFWAVERLSFDDEGHDMETGFHVSYTLVDDRISVSWMAPEGVLVYYVFVKASNGGWLYAYKDGATAGDFNWSPKDSVSHVTFHTLPVLPPGDEEPPPEEEDPPVDEEDPPVDEEPPPEEEDPPILEDDPPVVDDPQEDVEEEETPLEELPNTGGAEPALLYGLGALLTAAGYGMRRRLG